MRPVNLLPDRYRPLRGTGGRAGVAYIAVGVLAVLLVMVLLYVVTTNGINDANDKTAEAQAEQAAAQAKLGSLQPYAEFASLKATREAAVRTVAQSRFDYERLMREVALVLPHDTYLTSFNASGAGGTASSTTTTPTATTTTGTAGTTGTGPTVSVSGCAPSHPAVATAIVRLRKLHNVVDVDLQTSSKNSSTGASTAACKVSWTGSLTFQGEATPTSVARVPARLGGGP